MLGLALVHRARFVALFLAAVAVSFVLVPWLGRNFFPSVDAGEIAIHVRAPIGTRIEETAALFDHVEQTVRGVVPPHAIASIVDNMGLPNSGINLTYSNSGTIGPQDGDILVSLSGDHAPTADYVKQLRTRLPRAFPGVTFSFLPADIVSQILNFGAPAPIDVQVTGPDRAANRAYATELLRRIRGVPGWPMRACSRRRPIRSSPCRSTARGPHNSASPSRTSPMRWSPACPAQARCRRPTGSIRTTACRIRSSRRRPSTG